MCIGSWLHRTARSMAVLSLAAVCEAEAETLRDDELIRFLSGATLHAVTRLDRESWSVQFEKNGQVHFQFADRTKKSGTWSVNGERIEFVLGSKRETGCRMIDFDSSRQQHWKECGSGETTSFIQRPVYQAKVNPSAALSTAGPYASNVRQKLMAEVDSLSARGFELLQTFPIRELARTDTQRHQLDLAAGMKYAFVAACDQDCNRVEFRLSDRSGAELARSPEEHHTVIMVGAVPTAGSYGVALNVPGCKQRSCHLGFAILQERGGALR